MINYPFTLRKNGELEINLTKTQNLIILSEFEKDYKYLTEINEEIVKNRKVKINDYIIKDNGEISFFIGSPVLINNVSAGSIIFELSTSIFNKIMFDNNSNSGLGKSGESYIVGKDLLFRTSSRFLKNSICNIKVNTKATQAALLNKTGIEIIDDYRGVSVLSSYSLLKLSGLEWIIISEIDTNEALKPIYDLSNSIIILCVIVSILIFGFVYIGSFKLTNPIILLKNAAIKISQGYYNVRIDYKSNDEIFQLIQSFNMMVEQLAIQSEQLRKENIERISYVIDGQEMERLRLSRDLHDGLGQMLLAIKINLEQAKYCENGKSLNLIKRSLELLQDAINEIRSISNDLMPTVLNNFGLNEGIHKLCRDTIVNSNINLNYFCDNFNTSEINSKNQIYIFRIVQEILNNILKHSEAKNASIKLLNKSSFLEIIAEDDGKGFDLNIIKKGNGINNIRERTELLGGKCIINSNINSGTKININIPIQLNEKS